MNILELVRYNDVVRELYFDALTKLPWAEVVKPRGLSFDSARNVFLHLTLVEDRWINFILLKRFGEWKDPDFESYRDFSSLKKYMRHVSNSTENYLKKLSPKDFQRTIVNPWGDKPDTRITVDTALTHMVMEDMIHYGELSAMFWQMDVQAPYLAFWRYEHNLEKE